MSASKANCLVCGEPLAYWDEAQEVTCCVCGKKDCPFFPGADSEVKAKFQRLSLEA